jgi:ParB-like chromosome segregation protein Spo0J
MMRLPRSSIKGAEYNPRQIDPSARKKLEANLRKRGMVQPPVWNRRTGNLVGGHQRLEILDQLEGNDSYELDVAAIDVSPEQEKELNVFLNNSAAQGTWDLEKLGAMVQCEGVDLEQLGFDATELQFLLPDIRTIETAAFTNNDPAKADVETIRKMKESKKAYREGAGEANSSEFYFVVVFGTSEDLARFMRAAKIPVGERFVDGRKFAELLSLELGS